MLPLWITDPAAARRMIPGAYERNTQTPRQPGAMTGAPYGSADAPGGPGPLSPETVADRQREGGGGPSQRRVAVRSMVMASLIVLAAWPAHAAPGTYRGFTLGASTTEVMALATGATARDLKRVHDRPSVAEELTWRPPYRTETAGRDSVSRIVFSFVDNQLFRMVIDYDQRRIEGMTSADLIASLSSVYGARTPAAPAPRRKADESDAQTIVATWKQADTSIVLTQPVFGAGYGLVITSPKLEAQAKQAQAAALALDIKEAPAREAARAKAEADARRAAEEKTRTTNKEAFKP